MMSFYSVHYTLHLELHCPAIRPSLIVVSENGDNVVEFGKVSMGMYNCSTGSFRLCLPFLSNNLYYKHFRHFRVPNHWFLFNKFRIIYFSMQKTFMKDYKILKRELYFSPTHITAQVQVVFCFVLGQRHTHVISIQNISEKTLTVSFHVLHVN